MLKVIDVCEIPNHAMPYLVNDDCSGLDDAEMLKIDQWFNKNFSFYAPVTFDYIDEVPEFNSNPAFGLPCDTITVKVWAAK